MTSRHYRSCAQTAHGCEVLPIFSVGCWHWCRCHAVDDGRLLQTLVQHKDLVTCIDASSDGRTVVSGTKHHTLAVDATTVTCTTLIAAWHCVLPARQPLACRATAKVGHRSIPPEQVRICASALTGSRDTSLIIWDALPWPPRTRGTPALPLATSPRRVLYGHDDGVRSKQPKLNQACKALRRGEHESLWQAGVSACESTRWLMHSYHGSGTTRLL